jgi:hypothetical protein
MACPLCAKTWRTSSYDRPFAASVLPADPRKFASSARIRPFLPVRGVRAPWPDALSAVSGYPTGRNGLEPPILSGSRERCPTRDVTRAFRVRMTRVRGMGGRWPAEDRPATVAGR